MLEELFQKALLAYRKEDYGKAKELASECLAKNPQHRNSLQIIALCCYRLQDIESALKYFEQLSKLYPDASTYNNIGLLYKQQKNNLEAKAFYERAIKCDKNFSVAYFNLANLYRDTGNPQLSIDLYSKACELQTNFVEAWLNLGNAYKETYQYERALTCYHSALQYHKNYPEAYLNIGIVHLLTQNYPESLLFLQKALSLQPDFELAQIYLFSVETKICEWNEYRERLQQLKDICNKSIREQKSSLIDPFFALRFDLDEKLILAITQNHVRNVAEKFSVESQSFKYRNNPKLKIGYLTSDIKNHPVAHMLCDLLPYHNREQFEILIFSHTGAEHSEIRDKLTAFSDAFVDIAHLTDVQAAQLINQQDINILVDLNGHTQGCRLGILAQKSAPIQACHLGYPATTGATFIDYLYADQHLIKTESLSNYSEKIIFLPHVWQAHQFKYNSHHKEITREVFDIAQESFVYCCFNNNYKIEPDIFKLWMQILAKTPSSVLWMLCHSPLVIENLRKQANENGINPQRLIFSPPTDRASYLAQYLLCDLFLDTFIYNAHATAADALSMGLPILSLQGETFRGRVAMSYLSALNLMPLISYSPMEYFEKAIYFYHHKHELLEIREKILKNAATSPLFDINRYANNLEKSYQLIWQNYLQNKLPQHVWMSD